MSMEYIDNNKDPGYFISRELTEHSLINIFGSWQNENMYIMASPPVMRHDLFYIKVFNSDDLFTATKVARISLLKPEYIHCSDNPEWILNDDEKRQLIEILSAEVNNQMSHWELLLLDYEAEIEFAEYDIASLNMTKWKMPDYTKL